MGRGYDGERSWRLQAKKMTAAPAQFGNAVSEVGRLLRNDILSGRYTAGAHIRQQHVADELGLSHIPVREALKMLESEGFVKLEARRGFFVASISLEDAREIWRLRRTLEPMAVAASVPQVKPGHLIEAETALRTLSATTDHVAWLRTNWTFHSALYRAANQPRLLEFIETLWANVGRYCAILAVTESHYVRSSDHRQILEAYRSHDAAAATRIVIEHMDGVEARIAKVLEARR